MKFASAINSITNSTDLKRIAKAHLDDASRLDPEEVRKRLLKAEQLYTNPETIKARATEAVLNVNRNFRTITPILIGEVILQTRDHSCPQTESEEKVIEWEKQVIDESKEKEIGVSSCLLYTSPSPRDQRGSRMPSSA